MKIIVRRTDLLQRLIEIFEETDRTGAEGIQIEIQNNKLNISIIESGGLGCCDDFDHIKGLTPEEILDLT